MAEDVASKNKSGVKYRRSLNEQQVIVLHSLYWYRFCTSKQLAVSLKRANHKAIQNKLQILEDQGLIGKRYDKSYKLAGRPAEYFITPKGARTLEKAKPNTTNRWTDKSLYKNKTVSDDFVKHCIAIRETGIRLFDLYSEPEAHKLQRITKTYMVQFSEYPSWTPDLYLQYRPTKNTTQHYFLDIWDGTKPFFVSIRKTRNYVNFKESGDWIEDTPFPAILAICEDAYSQKKLNRQMKRILSDAWDDELIFATTTKQLLNDAAKPTDKIWSKIDVDDNGELITLKGLISVL
ncbi:replication-relaxation family protein [Candidatus Saccharibacteria bacterium]|nr:replication-relaxation family protein [Candidatus Saccharibacteria bacterium]